MILTERVKNQADFQLMPRKTWQGRKEWLINKWKFKES